MANIEDILGTRDCSPCADAIALCTNTTVVPSELSSFDLLVGIMRHFDAGQTSSLGTHYGLGRPRGLSPYRFLDLRKNRRLAMRNILDLLLADEGQDIAEYAVMLAVILVLVVGTIRLVGSNANNVFSQVGSSLNQ